ncbi:hypothetical protein JCGZ_09559 [Jatropha curcas]|uniref:Uncharacterized protein n=1 Tax=Jatropha curcas TaxID=180498 RepID=A0A067LKT4_JATCU|nr:hypothetical protein JCGZ_09559 [Jatropha curcas]
MEHPVDEAAASEKDGGSAKKGNEASVSNEHIPVYYTLLEGKFCISNIERSEMKDLEQLECEIERIALDDMPFQIPTKYVGVSETKYIGANEEPLSAEEMEWADFISKLSYVNVVGPISKPT